MYRIVDSVSVVVACDSHKLYISDHRMFEMDSPLFVQMQERITSIVICIACSSTNACVDSQSGH